MGISTAYRKEVSKLSQKKLVMDAVHANRNQVS